MAWLDKVGQKGQTFEERLNAGMKIADKIPKHKLDIALYIFIGFVIMIIIFSAGFLTGFERRCSIVSKESAQMCQEYIKENFRYYEQFKPPTILSNDNITGLSHKIT